MRKLISFYINVDNLKETIFFKFSTIVLTKYIKLLVLFVFERIYFKKFNLRIVTVLFKMRKIKAGVL
jgi:hypothetical protein